MPLRTQLSQSTKPRTHRANASPRQFPTRSCRSQRSTKGRLSDIVPGPAVQRNRQIVDSELPQTIDGGLAGDRDELYGASHRVRGQPKVSPDVVPRDQFAMSLANDRSEPYPHGLYVIPALEPCKLERRCQPAFQADRALICYARAAAMQLGCASNQRLAPSPLDKLYRRRQRDTSAPSRR